MAGSEERIVALLGLVLKHPEVLVLWAGHIIDGPYAGARGSASRVDSLRDKIPASCGWVTLVQFSLGGGHKLVSTAGVTRTSSRLMAG